MVAERSGHNTRRCCSVVDERINISISVSISCMQRKQCVLVKHLSVSMATPYVQQSVSSISGGSTWRSLVSDDRWARRGVVR